jgi:hypothetical protein
MKRRAPASREGGPQAALSNMTGAVALAFLAACSAHVDVGLSRDASPPPPHPDAGDGGILSDAGVTRTEPSAGGTTWARLRITPH